MGKHATELKHFPAAEPYSYVSIDILGPLIESNNGYTATFVIMDRFLEPTKTLLLFTTTTQDISTAFTTHLVFLYDPLSKLLADNRKQFTARFYTDMRRILGITNLYTTMYQPQTNGRAKRFNRTLLAALCHYVAERPRTRNQFIDALTYAYSTRPHSCTSFAPLELLSTPPPPTLTLEAPPTIMPKHSPRQWYQQWKHRLAALKNTADQQL